MAENAHDRIIAAEAAAALAPLGFRRKGRSRVWLADHDYWVSVVEFQPSSWSRGCYCNVAVHWLWNSKALSFDWGLQRVGQFAAFADADLFTQAVTAMAAGAAQAAEGHMRTFPSPAATAALLVRDEMARPTAAADWGAYHAGVACGLSGDAVTATKMFDRLLAIEPSTPWMVERAALTRRHKKVLGDRGAFRSQVQHLIDAQRHFLKLAPYTLA